MRRGGGLSSVQLESAVKKMEKSKAGKKGQNGRGDRGNSQSVGSQNLRKPSDDEVS